MRSVISSEIKKILAKPGIYVLSIFLAVILILGVFIYKPSDNHTKKIFLEGGSFEEKYSYFVGDGLTSGPKVEANKQLSKANNTIDSYYVVYESNTITQKEYFDILLSDLDEKMAYYSEVDWESSALANKQKERIKDQFVLINGFVQKAITNSANGCYAVVSSSKNFDNFEKLYPDIISWCNQTVGENQAPEHIALYNKLYQQDFEQFCDNLIFNNLSAGFLENYSTSTGSKLNLLNERLDEINNEIADLFNSSLIPHSDSEDVEMANKLEILANKYISNIETYTSLVKNELISSALKHTTTKQQLELKDLNNQSKFNANTQKIRLNYLFEHNKTEQDYAKPLTIGTKSNLETNAYDYAYFVMKVFSFVIVIYAVILASNSIAGEIKDGSMRYLAIRPVSRAEIYFGKMLAILIMSSILAVFSCIISICVGGAVYGFKTLNILTIFNGKSVLIIHPIGMIAIFIVSMLLQLSIYMLVASLLACLLKSDLASTTLVIVLYLINTILPMFVSGTNSWLAYYIFSHIDFYSMFGSSIYAQKSNIFSVLFGSKIYAGSSVWLTLCLLTLMIGAISTLTAYLFKKKEL